MKIQYISDLHLEFGGDPMANIPITGDILVLGGDIAVGINGLRFANHYAEDYKAIIVIAGNHEYYGKEYLTTLKALQDYDCKPNVHFLENDTVTIDGVKFVGATLWTDLGDWFDAQKAKNGMNDYHIIKYITRKLHPENTTKIHKDTVAYLEKEVDEDTVVITHHLPHYDCVAEIFKGSPLNPAFATNLDDFIANYKPKVWIHGHTHSTVDILVHDTNILCNPRGYHPYGFNPDFNVGKVVEI